MKNNVAVFILIILLASSFKYRSKTAVEGLNADHESVTEIVPLSESKPKTEFEHLISEMQEANRALTLGYPEKTKQLWSQSDDVTIFCGSSGVEVKGWTSEEERLDWFASQVSSGSAYSFERVSSQAGENFGSLQQTEHYKSREGQAIDLGVTVLFKKDDRGWKIIHRHAETLTSRVASM